MWWLTLWSEGLHALQWGVVLGAASVAAYIDLKDRRIPNALTLPMFFCGLAWVTWTAGSAGLVDAASACVLLATPYIYLYRYRGGGAGDVKLMAGIGAWVGVVNGLAILFFVSIGAVAVGLAWIALARHGANASADEPSTAPGSAGEGKKVDKAHQGHKPAQSPNDVEPLTMPYGVAIFTGVCMWLIGTVIYVG